jgi:hypothetical protein
VPDTLPTPQIVAGMDFSSDRQDPSTTNLADDIARNVKMPDVSSTVYPHHPRDVQRSTQIPSPVDPDPISMHSYPTHLVSIPGLGLGGGSVQVDARSTIHNVAGNQHNNNTTFNINTSGEAGMFSISHRNYSQVVISSCQGNGVKKYINGFLHPSH